MPRGSGSKDVIFSRLVKGERPLFSSQTSPLIREVKQHLLILKENILVSHKNLPAGVSFNKTEPERSAIGRLIRAYTTGQVSCPEPRCKKGRTLVYQGGVIPFQSKCTDCQGTGRLYPDSAVTVRERTIYILVAIKGTLADIEHKVSKTDKVTAQYMLALGYQIDELLTKVSKSRDLVA